MSQSWFKSTRNTAKAVDKQLAFRIYACGQAGAKHDALLKGVAAISRPCVMIHAQCMIPVKHMRYENFAFLTDLAGA